MTTQTTEKRTPELKVRFRLKELLQQHVDPTTGKPMSGRELSRRTGIRHRSVHYLMNGKAKELPFENLALICEELGCTPADLIELVPADFVEPEESEDQE